MADAARMLVRGSNVEQKRQGRGNVTKGRKTNGSLWFEVYRKETQDVAEAATDEREAK